MWNAIWETEAQIALRNCSKDVGGKDSIYVILAKVGNTLTAHIFCRKFLLVS